MSKELEELKENCRVLVGLVDTKQEVTSSLSKKLAIAIEALEWIEKHSDKFDCSWGVAEQLDSIKAQAQESLQQIKELEK